MAEKKSITKNMKLGELVEKYPESVEVMLNYGLHCVGCHVAGFETIEQGAKAHGMSNEDIDKMMKEVNEAINKPMAKEKETETKEIEKENQIKAENKTNKKGFLRNFFQKMF